MDEATFDRLRQYVADNFRGGTHSIHGPAHWRRVEENAIMIAEREGADITVVRLFAIFHDSCRDDDGSDLQHGPRAADLLGRIAGSLFELDAERLKLLQYAIRYHTSGQVTDDPTVGTCWDADRLEIGRAGLVPDPRYMSTATARGLARRH